MQQAADGVGDGGVGAIEVGFGASVNCLNILVCRASGFRISGFGISGQGLILGGADASSTTSAPFQPDPSGFSSNRATSNKFRKLTPAPQPNQI